MSSSHDLSALSIEFQLTTVGHDCSVSCVASPCWVWSPQVPTLSLLSAYDCLSIFMSFLCAAMSTFFWQRTSFVFFISRDTLYPSIKGTPSHQQVSATPTILIIYCWHLSPWCTISTFYSRDECLPPNFVENICAPFCSAHTWNWHRPFSFLFWLHLLWRFLLFIPFNPWSLTSNVVSMTIFFTFT